MRLKESGGGPAVLNRREARREKHDPRCISNGKAEWGGHGVWIVCRQFCICQRGSQYHTHGSTRVLLKRPGEAWERTGNSGTDGNETSHSKGVYCSVRTSSAGWCAGRGGGGRATDTSSTSGVLPCIDMGDDRVGPVSSGVRTDRDRHMRALPQS